MIIAICLLHIQGNLTIPDYDGREGSWLGEVKLVKFLNLNRKYKNYQIKEYINKWLTKSKEEKLGNKKGGVQGG